MPNIVSREEWLDARISLLTKEKEFTRQSDELAKLRREMPYVKIEKDYVFEGADGRVTFSDLFDGRPQLLVYHFMLGPDWSEGCKSCSFWADSYQHASTHLKHRGVSFVTVAHAPYEKIVAYKERMGWDFAWYSTSGEEFGRDFHVHHTKAELDAGNTYYNYKSGVGVADEMPGVSTFVKNEAGDIFHAYSAYARGVEPLNNVYSILDLMPFGRDEDQFDTPMQWLRHSDKYDV